MPKPKRVNHWRRSQGWVAAGWLLASIYIVVRWCAELADVEEFAGAEQELAEVGEGEVRGVGVVGGGVVGGFGGDHFAPEVEVALWWWTGERDFERGGYCVVG